MSFGFSPSDVVLLVQSAWTTVRNSRKACGEYAELTREVTSLHVNLQRLERETAKPESPINRPSDTCRQDLAPIVDGCGKTLDVLDRILEKYNALSDEERSKRKLWKAVRFGNGELANVKDLRSKLTYYTSNLALFLNMVSMGSMGIVEKQMYEAGGDLKDIRRAVNGITAHLMSAANKEGSVLTDYADDDRAVWKAFRRELITEGFSSDVIRVHKDTIQAYVKELGSRGILDDEEFKDSGNVSEDIEDTAPAQATSQSRDEGMDSFQHKTGAARDEVSASTSTTALFEHKIGAARDGSSPRTGTNGHIGGSSGTANRDAREDQTFPQQTQTAPTPLTMNNIADTPPSTTQADAEIDSVVESDSKEVEKVGDGKNRPRSSAPSSLARHDPEIAEVSILKPFRHDFRYYTYDYHDEKWILHFRRSQHRGLEALFNRLVARSESLEFQEEAKGFLKVAELRIPLRKQMSRNCLLRLSPLFNTSKKIARDGLSDLIFKKDRGTIIAGLLQYGLHHIDARPEKWRITQWPSPLEDIQDPSSTTEEVETEEDEENQRTDTDEHQRTEEQKRDWKEIVKEAELMKEQNLPRKSVATSSPWDFPTRTYEQAKSIPNTDL